MAGEGAASESGAGTAPPSVRMASLHASADHRLAALREVLGELLARRLVEALLVPVEVSEGVVAPALLTDPSRLEKAEVPALSMPSNLARVLRGVAAESGPRVGVVLRPCEVRALVELAKLRQVDRERLFVVAVDCLGTYAVAERRRLGRECPAALDRALERASVGDVSPEPGFALRSACRICDRPLASQLGDGWDLAVELVGSGDRVGLEFAAGASAEADALSDALHLEAMARSGARAGDEELLKDRSSARSEALGGVRAALAASSGLADAFAACVRCGNCSTACPICYCRECLFRSATFERTLDDHVRSAGRKGAARLPSDTLLYHLTRMSHVAASCVGCGACEEACPNGIPLTYLFAAVARRVQATFDYEPGRSLAEPLPLATFREQELST